MPQGPGTASRIPLLNRQLVLALNWRARLSFDSIAIKAHVNSTTARRIDQRCHSFHEKLNRCIFEGENNNFDA